MKPAYPYPGLRPFRENDRAIFFGRDAQIVSVLSLLQEQQFVAVVGSSGSGKSSLILAGLIPAVREGFLRGTRQWTIVDLKPGNDPCRRLARALAAKSPTPAAKSEDTLIQQLRASDSSLIDLLLAPPATGAPAAGSGSESDDAEENEAEHFLIIVDQFEELFGFRLAQDKMDPDGAQATRRDDAATFVRLLLNASAEPTGRIAVVITMRSDFIGDCDTFLLLPEVISRCQFLVPRMNRSQMREAIVRPGQQDEAGYAPFTFEDGLVDRIIAEAGDRLDQLPLMQHALMQTWKKAGGAKATALKASEYHAVGGIAEALSNHADQAWEQIKRDPVKSALARQIFLLLCDLHSDGKVVRRRPRLAEVRAATGAKLPAIKEIVRLFQADDRNFLLPPLDQNTPLQESDYLDISHEALLRQWKEFARWIVRETESKFRLQRLSRVAEEHEIDPKKTDLWQRNDLRAAELWLQQENPSKPWAERYSVHNWDRCLHFLEASRNLEQRRARNRKVYYILGVLIGVGICGIIGLLQSNKTKQEDERKLQLKQREEQYKLGLAVQQTNYIQAATSIAIVASEPVAVAAEAAVASVEQRAKALIDELKNANDKQPLNDLSIAGLAQARDTADLGIELLETLAKSIADGGRLSGIDQELSKNAGNLREAAEGLRQRLVVAIEQSGASELISEALPKHLKLAYAARDKLGSSVEAIAKKLKESTPELRSSFYAEIEGQLRAIRLLANAAKVFAVDDFVDYSNYGQEFEEEYQKIRKAAEMSSSGPAIEDWALERAVARLPAKGRVVRVRFAPQVVEGKPLIAVLSSEENESTISFWTPDGKERANEGIHNASNDLDFNPNGSALAVASNGSTVRILQWNRAFNAISSKPISRHNDAITDVEFSHGGERLVSASADRTVRVFQTASLAQIYYSNPPLPGIVTAVQFHPRDNLVVSGCDDGVVRLHTVDEPGVQVIGNFGGTPVRRPEFSPDGKLILAASGDRTARVWPIRPPYHEIKVTHPAAVNHATFRPLASAAEYQFVTCAANGEVRLGRLTDLPTASAELTAKVLNPKHPGPVVFAQWSKDGKWLATVSDREVLLWNWSGEEPQATIRLVYPTTSPAAGRVEFSPDAKFVVTYGTGPEAYLWSLPQKP